MAPPFQLDHGGTPFKQLIHDTRYNGTNTMDGPPSDNDLVVVLEIFVSSSEDEHVVEGLG